MRELNYLLQRLGRLLLILFGLSVIIFCVARLVPGDPARIALGPLASEEQVVALRAKMGMDRPAVVQYARYIGGVLHGDFGPSLLTGRGVETDIAQALPATLELVLFTLLLMMLVAIPLGVLAAWRPNGWFDQLTRIVSLLGVVTPAFLIALVLQLLASLGWFALPVTERLTNGLNFTPGPSGLLLVDSLLTGRIEVFLDALRHLLLPGCALAAAGIGQVMRITRSSMIEFSHRDHVATLRACGVSKSKIYLKYLLRLSASAPLTILGLEFASLMGNAFIVEMVFSWPGMASYGIRAILHKDFNAVMGVVLVSGLFFIVANLLIDFIVSLVDPRLKHKGA